MNITVPVSVGEVIDKVTILEIKSERISDEAKLKNGQSRRLVLEAENEQVVVFRHRRKLFAIDNRCAHQGGNLCAGDVEDLGTVLRHRTKAPPKSVNACLEDGVVRCPRHGLCFNIRTGEYVDDPDSGTLRQRVFLSLIHI